MRPVSLIFRISAMFAMSSLAAAFPSFSPALQGTSQPRAATTPEIKTIIWQDPGTVEELDFAAGPGSQKKVPAPPFTFIEENLAGSNPKINVKDANDTTWHVKWGSEVNAEVFATRMA